MNEDDEKLMWCVTESCVRAWRVSQEFGIKNYAPPDQQQMQLDIVEMKYKQAIANLGKPGAAPTELFAMIFSEGLNEEDKKLMRCVTKSCVKAWRDSQELGIKNYAPLAQQQGQLAVMEEKYQQ